MSDEKQYPWESLMPSGCDAVREGFRTQEGDLQMVYDGSWREIDIDTAGSSVTYLSAPTCRPRKRKFCISVSEGGTTTTCRSAGPGDMFQVDTHGMLTIVKKTT